MDVKKLMLMTALFGVAGCNSQKFSLQPAQATFAQKISYNNQVDILWVLDNSGSMSDKEAYMMQQAQPFLGAVQALGMNFHMGFVTTDMRNVSTSAHGRLLPFDGSAPTVLSPATSDLQNQFVSHMNVGSSGSTVEQGLGAMRSALSSDYLSSYNQGFLRSSSFLVMIFASDEDDESADADDITMLDSLRPPRASGEKGWMADYIGVLPSDSAATGCTSNPRGYTDPGLKYINLANASGGVVQSICTGDFSQVLQNIKAAIVEVITEYNLPQEPDISTIQVLVNGQVVPQDPTNGWTYSATGYTVKFHGTSVPPADASIVVNYQPLHAK